MIVKSDMRIVRSILEDFVNKNRKNGDYAKVYEAHRVEKILEKLNTPVNAHDLVTKQGGEWLATMRKWIQRKCSNGESVAWGSNEILNMGSGNSCRDFERLAAEIAEAAINEVLGLD